MNISIYHLLLLWLQRLSSDCCTYVQICGAGVNIKPNFLMSRRDARLDCSSHCITELHTLILQTNIQQWSVRFLMFSLFLALSVKSVNNRHPIYFTILIAISWSKSVSYNNRTDNSCWFLQNTSYRRTQIQFQHYCFPCSIQRKMLSLALTRMNMNIHEKA